MTTSRAHAPHADPAGRSRCVLGERTWVMGVLNVTPDSFSDGGRFAERRTPRSRTASRCSRRAPTSWTWAASPRGPAPQPVAADEEMPAGGARDRGAARAAAPGFALGRHHEGGGGAGRARRRRRPRQRRQRLPLRSRDGRAGGASAACPAVLMHLRGDFAGDAPRSPPTATWWARWRPSSRERLRAPQRAGVRARAARSSIPGIGFAKDARPQPGGCCAGCPSCASLDRPLLVGPSRKSFIGRVLDLPVGRAAAGHRRPRWPPACWRGAHVVRVHDVREMVEVARVCDAILGDAAGGRRVIAERARPRSSRATEFSLAATLLDILIVAFIIYELLQLHPRHARGADGARRRGAGAALLGLAAGSTWRRSTGCCARSCPTWSSASSWCSRPRSGRCWRTSGKTPLLGAFARAAHGGGDRRGGAGRHHARLAAHRRDHRASSARWACAATSRPASRSTRSSPTTCWSASSTRARRCTTARSIIQGNRVAAAACFLPLTVNPELSRAAGQPPPRGHRRHRGHRRGRRRGLRGDRHHLAGGGRPHPPRARRPRAEAGAARAAGGGGGASREAAPAAAGARRPRRRSDALPGSTTCR